MIILVTYYSTCALVVVVVVVVSHFVAHDFSQVTAALFIVSCRQTDN